RGSGALAFRERPAESGFVGSVECQSVNRATRRGQVVCGSEKSNRGCASRDPQDAIPFQPGELFCRDLMLLLRPLEQPRELRSLPNGIEPWIAAHGGITKDPAPDHTLEQLQCGIGLVQVCQMPRQIKEPFRIAERGIEKTPDGGDAAHWIAFDH